MKTAREFKSCSMRYGDRLVGGIEVRCPCGTTAQHPRGSTKTNVGPKEEAQRYAAMFVREGWTIGDRPRDDRCPKCTREFGKKPKEKPVMPHELSDRASQLAPLVSQASHVSQALREPTREDKRLVMAKLEDTYDTANQRYSASWTDAKVAVDLGCPRAWVERLRNEFFGPEGSNQEINAAVNQANAVLAQCQTLLANTDKAIKDCTSTLGALTGEHQRLTAIVQRTQRGIETIEKAVRP